MLVIILICCQLFLPHLYHVQELLKYEVHEDTYTLNKHLSEPCHAPLARHRVTLLSLVCRVLDDIMHLEEPNLDCMGTQCHTNILTTNHSDLASD